MLIHTNDTKIIVNDAKREIIYPELSYKLNGLFFEIQKDLGRFCRERQYADALEEKLKQSNIEYEREKNIENIFQSRYLKPKRIINNEFRDIRENSH